MKKMLLLLFMLSFLKAEEMQQRIRMLMGTYVTVTLPASKTTFIFSIFEHIAQIEHSLLTYDADAVLYNLNQHHKVPYDAHLAEG